MKNKKEVNSNFCNLSPVVSPLFCHSLFRVKLVLPEYQELREKTAKMAHLENLVPMDFQELQGKEYVSFVGHKRKVLWQAFSRYFTPRVKRCV